MRFLDVQTTGEFMKLKNEAVPISGNNRIQLIGTCADELAL